MTWLALSLASATPLVIGHRGAPGYLPDHTLESYTLAVEQGADYIEPDLVATRDGHLVARHDLVLESTTDVAKKFAGRKTTKQVDGKEVTGWFVDDFTLAELKTLRAVQPYPDRPHEFDGKYVVPTFDEVLKLIVALSDKHGRAVGVYPETKHPSYFEAAGLPLEGPMLEALSTHGFVGPEVPVILQSFELSSLDKVRGAGHPLLLLIDEPDLKPFGDTCTFGELLSDLPALRLQVDGIGVAKSAVWSETGPTDLLARAHEAGLFVHVYTFRDEARKLGPAADGSAETELRRFYELGVDGVFSDHPDTAVRARRDIPQ